MSDIAAPPLRRRVSRKVGKQHMVDAAIELLQTRSPDDITVRDIAAASGHHHRFVQAWFDGKVGLFRATFDRLLVLEAERVQGPSSSSDLGRPELLVLVRLMNWLVAAEPGCLDGPRPTPILERTVELYRERYGLSETSARLMALRAIGGVISTLLFAGPLGMTPDDVVEMTALEGRLVSLLADSERAGD